MIAYKFLRYGRIGPFSEFRWPAPGVWVRAAPEATVCERGVHACRTADLPWWLADELWEVELGGEVAADRHKIVATAGRLQSRIREWTPACAQEYADACAWRGRDRAVEALAGSAHGEAADRLACCTTLQELLAAARRLAAEIAETRITLTIAGDGAVRALSGAAPTAAYIAAHAALRLHGPAAYIAERAWQSRWLTEQLQLRPDC